MDRESLCVAVMLLLCVASSESALRMCTRCECTYKGDIVKIDCSQQQLNEMHLRQIQNNPNSAFISLNFSNNNFSKVPAGLNTRGVEYLDLSINQIKHLNNLNNYKDLLDLNLAHNKIQDLGDDILNLLVLKSLNMSHCSLNNLKIFGNSTLNELITLDLSNNEIKHFDQQYLKSMRKLKYLDLSFNFIKKLDILQFKHLQILNIESNIIGPEFVFPYTLLELNAQNNSISEVFMNEEINKTNSSLVFLYLNKNKLTTLPNISFSSLRILDLRKNELKTVPIVLNKDQCPILEILLLSENEFENFKFTSKIQLLNLQLNRIKSIRKLKKDMFKMLENYSNNCINITIKDNPELHIVESNIFEHLDVCFLNLENNSLSHLPQIQTNSGDWRSIKNGINFQKNPIVCDCAAQWILDDFVSFYYGKRNLEHLLSDLRCADPYYVQHYRLVHWYNWTKPVFCEDEATVIARMTIFNAEKSFHEIFLHSSGTMLLILVICTAFLATLFVVALVLAKRAAVRKTKRNRRF